MGQFHLDVPHLLKALSTVLKILMGVNYDYHTGPRRFSKIL